MKNPIDMTTPIGVWLANELDQVSLVMSDHLKNKHKEVTAICEELAAYRGKMLRPTMLLLSWKSVSSCETTPEAVRVAAGVVELIHLATLVHDDILDESDLRRGAQTINSLLGNEAAVMLGDYLLSSAFLLCSTIKNPELNLLLGKVTNTLCAGELVQLSRRNDMDLDIESYFQIIRDKTASLIAASCEMGAVLGGGSGREIKALKEFGSSVGMAFQIKDDLLDLLGERAIIGKPAGRDLDKGKLTLPVITMLVENPS
jgi:octaprenyl-diphosphate synthase